MPKNARFLNVVLGWLVPRWVEACPQGVFQRYDGSHIGHALSREQSRKCPWVDSCFSRKLPVRPTETVARSVHSPNKLRSHQRVCGSIFGEWSPGPRTARCNACGGFSVAAGHECHPPVQLLACRPAWGTFPHSRLGLVRPSIVERSESSPSQSVAHVHHLCDPEGGTTTEVRDASNGVNTGGDSP